MDTGSRVLDKYTIAARGPDEMLGRLYLAEADDGSLVDVKVLGTLGADAVAASTAGHRLFFILQAVLMSVTAGPTALVARAW